MRKVYSIMINMLGVAVLAQFFLAGFGAINPAPVEESFGIHQTLGRIMVAYSLLLIGAAALARAPGRLIGMTALVAGLMVAQSLIRLISDGTTTTGQLIFGLHAVNAGVILFVLHTIGERAKALGAAPTAESAKA